MQDFKHHLRDPAIADAIHIIKRCGLSVTFKPISVEIHAPNGLLLIELYSKPQILHFARELRATPPDPTPDDPQQRLIDTLQAELTRERDQHKALAAQHAQLQSRLAATEQKLQSALTATAAERRYTRLKTLLAKQLHPDQFHGPPAEKRHRTDLFKQIWPQIEALEKS